MVDENKKIIIILQTLTRGVLIFDEVLEVSDLPYEHYVKVDDSYFSLYVVVYKYVLVYRQICTSVLTHRCGGA